MDGFMDALLKRRSTYCINDQITITDDALKSLLAEILKNTPTAFNMQSTRMVLLLKEEHKKLWDLVAGILKQYTPPESFGKTLKKIQDCFACGHGTILYFDDSSITKQMAKDYSLYEELFPDWALQQNGMLQHAVWCALAERDIGATLQHYNPIIDDMVKKQWGLPEHWRLLAQMPFGNITQPADPKDFAPIGERFFIAE